MPFRFRKSIKIVPGIRLNLGKSGRSLTIGKRGASFNIGKKGVYSNIGIPGTGLSTRNRMLGGFTRNTSGKSSSQRQYDVSVMHSKNGQKSYQDLGFGSDVTERLQYQAENFKGTKLQRSQQIAHLLTEEAARMNGIIEAGINQHLKIPLDQNITLEEQIPNISPPSILLPMFISASLTAIAVKYHPVLIFGIPVIWITYVIYRSRCLRQQEKVQEANDASSRLAEQVRLGNTESMNDVLDSILDTMDFYREVSVEYNILERGKYIALSVSLPSMEDMPGVNMVAIKTRLSIKGKPKSKKDQRIEYETYCCGLLLRLAGLCFHLFPTIEKIACTGFIKDFDIEGNTSKTERHTIQFSKNEWSRIKIHNINPVALVEKYAKM